MGKDTKTDNKGISENQEDKHKQAKENIAPWMWKPGQSGNPNGRPKGKTLKERARELFQTMSDEEFTAFLEGMPKLDVWKMAEGNPESKIEAKVETTNIITPEMQLLASQLNQLNTNENNSGTSEPSDGIIASVMGEKVSDKE